MKNSFASPIMSGLIYMLSIVLIGSIITALLIQYTSLSEGKLPIFTYGVNLIGLLIGGFIAGRRAQERGWLYGGMTGIIYAFILSIIALLAFDTSLSLNTLVSLIGAFSSGAIGGILGVNFANK